MNEANAVLSDPEKRHSTTASARTGRRTRARATAGAGAGARAGAAGDPFAGFTGFGGQGGNVRYEFHTTGDAGEFSDFFQAFFGGATARSGAGRGTRPPTGGATFEDILASWPGRERRRSRPLRGMGNSRPGGT